MHHPKKASTKAYQTLSPENQLRVQVFWNHGPPLGVKMVPRYKLIDVDDFAITLMKCNKKKGWALMCSRVRKYGHYKAGHKITVILAIEPGDPRLSQGMRGSVDNPRRWVRIIQNGGTTTIVFRDFCDYICTDIETNPVVGFGTDDHRVFLWDNLNSHHSAYVIQTVTGRIGPSQFSIVPRPPYQPKYGPIEYKICDLTHDVSRHKGDRWNTA